MKNMTFRIGLLIVIFALAAGMVGVSSALAQPAQVGTVGINPITAAKSGAPGSSVSYSLTVTNTATVVDTFTVTVGTHTWETLISPSLGPVDANGGTASLNVVVNIPASAANNDTDAVTVTVTSQADPTNTYDSATLTTTARVPTITPTPTLTPTLEPTQVPGSVRPLVVLKSYSAGDKSVSPGTEFELSLRLENIGKSQASNLVLAFEGADFLPRGTGGVRALTNLASGSDANITQTFLPVNELWGKAVGTLTAKLSYTDTAGQAYTENFNLTINLKVPVYTTPKPTITPTTVARPQVVVSGYTTDVDPLQPGTIFNLELEVRNLGLADARNVTLVLGGGVQPDVQGTPSGGTSGGSGDLTNFAPLGTSNLAYIGDVAAGSVTKTTQKLIVNTTTNPGAYSLKMSFVYTDPRGTRLVDEQVITLLVYSLPQIDASFYRDPGIMMTGQPNQLPLQVNNLGRKTAVLGNLKVTAANGEVLNNTSLVGNLEPGGLFTLDSTFIPMAAGDQELTLTINYTDDFNQPRTIVKTLVVNVQEAAPIEPGTSGDGTTVIPGKGDPGTLPQTTERPWLERLIMGLLGLDSAPTLPQPVQMLPTEIPGNTIPVKPIIIPGGKG